MPTYSRTFPGLPEQIRTARRFAAQCLTGTPAAEHVTLMVSEVATNAVQHSRSGHPHGHFTMTITTRAEHARVEIQDAGSPIGASPRLSPARPDDESSRGLLIVQALADDWGTHHPNTVWFEVTWSLPRSETPQLQTTRS